MYAPGVLVEVYYKTNSCSDFVNEMSRYNMQSIDAEYYWQLMYLITKDGKKDPTNPRKQKG